MPADPVSQMVGTDGSRDAYMQAAHTLGLDRSLLQQLGQLPRRVLG